MTRYRQVGKIQGRETFRARKREKERERRRSEEQNGNPGWQSHHGSTISRRRSSVHETYASRRDIPKMRVLAPVTIFVAILMTWGCANIITWREMRREGPIRDAIESGAAAEYNKDDCVWRRGNDRDVCPDPDVQVYLYTPGRSRRTLDTLGQSDWLRQDYEPTRDNVILIHGYAGKSLRSYPELWRNIPKKEEIFEYLA